MNELTNAEQQLIVERLWRRAQLVTRDGVELPKITSRYNREALKGWMHENEVRVKR